MPRISVVGNSGSGKSTLGRSVAARLSCSYVELDSIFHQPGWVPLPVDEFRARVAGVLRADSWVVDGNYSAVRDLIWARADMLVWLDLPRARVMSQLVRRTFRRGVRRTELWNGNRESLRNLVRWDPNLSILRWAWTNHEKYRLRYSAAAEDPVYSHIEFVRLTNRAEIAQWLDSVGAVQVDAESR
jgi:adenylate kinase family enzyme